MSERERGVGVALDPCGTKKDSWKVKSQLCAAGAALALPPARARGSVPVLPLLS